MIMLPGRTLRLISLFSYCTGETESSPGVARSPVTRTTRIVSVDSLVAMLVSSVFALYILWWISMYPMAGKRTNTTIMEIANLVLVFIF